MTTTTQHAPEAFKAKPDAEANCFMILDAKGTGNWLAHIRFNGELSDARQNAVAASFASAPDLLRERDALKAQTENLKKAINQAEENYLSALRPDFQLSKPYLEALQRAEKAETKCGELLAALKTLSMYFDKSNPEHEAFIEKAAPIIRPCTRNLMPKWSVVFGIKLKPPSPARRHDNG